MKTDQDTSIIDGFDLLLTSASVIKGVPNYHHDDVNDALRPLRRKTNQKDRVRSHDQFEPISVEVEFFVKVKFCEEVKIWFYVDAEFCVEVEFC